MNTAATARTGALAALGAFLCWGVFGIYFKALGEIPALEVLAHRVLGGTVFALALQAALGGVGEIRRVFRSRRLVLGLTASALAIVVNWGAFIWAVTHGRALEGSLGYFIYPLMSVLFARVFLGEHMSLRQGAAIALVALGVGWQVWRGDGVPWLALVVAVSFCAYGLLRKAIPVQALSGLFVETVLLAPLAVAYLVWDGGGVAPQVSGGTQVLLAAAGPVTAVPLVLFAMGARRLRASTLGLMMYVNPTIQMLVAVFLFGEAFTAAHGVTFAAIWCGLVLYSWPRRA
ncbi:MAG: EamA family transporter RarD [Rhodospirillaceae bacterium]|nr:EamA family transporter RarD [Rhodospirillales bacterium]